MPRRPATIGALGAAVLTAASGAQAPPVEPGTVETPRALAEAPKVEKQTFERLLAGTAWPRRALAAMRLERYECDESLELLEGLRADESWQVRAFAVRTLGRRRAVLPDGAFDDEQEPRVLRSALRHGYTADVERLGRGVRFLSRSSNLESKMLAVELGIASGDPDLMELATETARTVILRMGRIEAGSLSPRLAAVTGQPDMRRNYRWQNWLRKVGRRFALQPALGVPESPDEPVEPGVLAGLDAQEFAALEAYIDDLGERSVDLAILLDCTASMARELADAQGGIDDLMLFAGDMVAGLRVAIVAYRDQRDEFETRAWDFTDQLDVARRNLWSLTAAGGGDRPESVYEAMRLGYGRLTWIPRHRKIMVLIGDGPPHVGRGTQCVDMAERAAIVGELTTHVIEADPRTVKHFCEIAEAGGGRCVSLGDESLIVEIAGLTLGDRFREPLREFFLAYQLLCR